MGLTDFIHIRRADPLRRPIEERTKDWRELYERSSDETLRSQGGRCMDCGVPFCQGDTGCPVQNVIPEWNALVKADRWREASVALHATNNFPEFTGRLCPAPCESACVLGVIEQPVAIRSIEQAIADRALGAGWVEPQRPHRDTGFRVAVVGLDDDRPHRRDHVARHATILLRQIVHREVNARERAARNVQLTSLHRATGQQHGIECGPERVDLDIDANIHARLEHHPFVHELRDARVEDRLVHLEVRNTIPQQPAHAIRLLENHHVVSGASDLLRGRQARRSRPHDAHAVTRLAMRPLRPDPAGA